MILNIILRKLERFLFYLIVISIPLNLGKHYVSEMSYVYGKLIDYLIPTIYVQDILIFLLILISLPRLLSAFVRILKRGPSIFVFLILFFVSLFFSVLDAHALIPALSYFIRFCLYGSFGFYVFCHRDFEKDFRYLSWIFIFLIVSLVFLGIGQWYKQSSVFNNYLFFGEQPYSFSTPQIVKENLFGVSRVPPYGTFRHPNVFAAFLNFSLLFITPFVFSKEKKFFLYLIYFFGLMVLLLTFSWFVCFVFLLSFASLLLSSKFNKFIKFLPWLFLLVGVFSTLLLLYPYYSNPSFYMRRNLILIGLNLLPSNFLFGVGLNNFTLFADLQASLLGLPRFPQPIHNVYLLLFVESGIFAFTFFVLFLASLVKTFFSNKTSIEITKKSLNYHLLILLLNLLVLGFFDHFLLTSQQMLLVFWLTVGFALQYNLFNGTKTAYLKNR